MMEDSNTVFFVFLMGAVIIIAGILGYFAVHNLTDDDKPDWSDEMADELSKNGGRIDLYYTGGGNTTRNTYTVYIDKGQDIRAENDGLVIYGNQGISHFPYERIATIWIG